MKKMFFTALAVMAFSGVAMAENKVVIKKYNCTKCYQFAMDYVTFMVAHDTPPEEVNDQYQLALASCIANGGCN